jgi:hypothetical protein
MRFFNRSRAFRIAEALMQTITIVMFSTVISDHFIGCDATSRHSDSV